MEASPASPAVWRNGFEVLFLCLRGFYVFAALVHEFLLRCCGALGVEGVTGLRAETKFSGVWELFVVTDGARVFELQLQTGMLASGITCFNLQRFYEGFSLLCLNLDT